MSINVRLRAAGAAVAASALLMSTLATGSAQASTLDGCTRNDQGMSCTAQVRIVFNYYTVRVYVGYRGDYANQAWGDLETNDQVWMDRSSDGGRTWTAVGRHPHYTGTFPSDGRYWRACAQGHDGYVCTQWAH